MRMAIHLPVLAAVLVSAGAAAASPEAVLQQVQQQQAESAKFNQEREARFVREKAEAAARQSQAQKALQAIKSRSNSLKAQYEANQKQIAELQGEQSIEADDATELPRALRLAAGNLQTLLADSLVNAQYPEREQLLGRMADAKTTPGTRDLELLWHALENQLRESGRVARFSADVHDGDDVGKADVIRAGEFSAVKENGRFLLYEPHKGLVEAGHQPGWHWRHVASRFAGTESGLAPMAIDPGAGSVLRKIARQPDVFGRIVKILLLFVLLMLAVPQVRRLWVPPRRRVAAAGPVAEALAVYDSRFNVALFVSLWHLAFLLWLLQSLFASDNATAELATAQEVFQIVPIEAPPAANVQQAAASGAPAPPPPIPAPTLSIPPPRSTVQAPVEVAMPSINVPMQIQSGGALFGSQFAGFAGSAGNGNGAGGAGSGTGGGGFGRGVGGGGKPIIPLSTARPQISDYAFQRGIEGWVVVTFTVGTEGRVKNIRIVDADPKGVFEAAAVESIANWIYPRLDHDAELTQRIEFKLEDHQYNWNR